LINLKGYSSLGDDRFFFFCHPVIQYSFSANLISGYAENADLSNDMLKIQNEIATLCSESATKWSQMLRRHPTTEK